MTNFEIKTMYLKSGWSEGSVFSDKVNQVVFEQMANGWVYFDVKISSRDNDCLIIFKRWINRL